MGRITPPQLSQARASGAFALVYNVKAYGATGDGTTDDGPAVQDAVDAIITAGGGTLYFPTGSYIIDTPVSSGDSPKLHLRIQGNGGSTKIKPTLGSGQTCFRFRNCGMVSIDNLWFVGTAANAYDAYMVIDTSATPYTTYTNVQFHGLLSQPSAGGCIVNADGTTLVMRDVIFGACGGNPTTSNSVVRVKSCPGALIDNVRFTDYASESGFGTGRGQPYAWMRFEEPTAALSTAWNQSPIVIRNLQMDEGGARGLVIEGGANKYEHVRLSGIRGNITVATTASGGYGVYVDNVNKLSIEDSFYSYQSNPDRVGFYVGNCEVARLRNVIATGGAGIIELASTVAYAEVIDCEYDTLTNNATVSTVAAGAAQAPSPAVNELRISPLLFRQVAGAPSVGSAAANLACQSFADGSTGTVAATLLFPADWSTYNVEVWWTPAAGTGDVVWQFARDSFAPTDGADLTSAGISTSAAVADTAPAANIMSVATLASGVAVPTAGDTAILRVSRLGADAADTLSGAAAALMVMVRLVKAS